jgi:type IV secretory pathway TraG/TraD family ATPase VirD4
MIEFGPDTPRRFNPLQYLVSKGADAREITDFLLTVGERLEGAGDGSGSSGDAKWFAAQNRLWLYNAVVILKIATGTVTATDLLHFLSTAANSPAELNDPEWRLRCHNQRLKRAHEKPKSRNDANDCELANDQWLSQWPTMGDKTRGSILAGMNAMLHTANTGVVRAMLSENTNCSPDTMLEKGKSVLINFPTSDSGPTGRFICGAWKYCTQWQVLRRRPDDRHFVNILWCDEFQEVVTNFDPRYLARCRAFRGCMVCLTQSIHSLYSNLTGESGKNQANALMGNYRYKLAHSLADYETAEMFSNLLGKSLQTFVGGSSAPQRDLFDDFFGNNTYTGNFSEHFEQILHPNAFMGGLRTGRDGVSDAILIRSGEPFPNGANYLKCTFTRKDRR